MAKRPERPRGIMLLVVGAGVVTTARAMSMTFLPIELQQKFGLDPAMIGVLLGIGPMLGAIIAPFLGWLSDRVSRKCILVLVMVCMAIAMFGMAVAGTVVTFCVAQTCAAVAIAVYGPMSRALMSDICPEPERLKYFSWRYMASNVGWVVGPMIGVAAGAATTTLFVLAGAVYAALAAILQFLHMSNVEASEASYTSMQMPLMTSIKLMIGDRRLVFFFFGGALLMAVYGQWPATLAPYLAANVAGGTELFAYLVSINGAVVLLGNPAARRLIERVGPFASLMIGCVLFTASQFGFLLAASWAAFAVSMIVFTVGEILVVTSEYKLIDGISSDSNRGSYYGAYALSTAGGFIGPSLGGFTLGVLGSSSMFMLFATFSVASALLFIVGNRPPL